MNSVFDITPEILREAGYKESHFPNTVYKANAKLNNKEYYVEFAPNKNNRCFRLTIRQYPTDIIGTRDLGLQDHCVFHNISSVEKANRIIELVTDDNSIFKLPE